MRAKKLFSILLAMMLMLFTLFPIQAVLAETTNQPSQTTSTAEPPASSAVPTQRSDTPAPTSGAEPGVETPVDVSGQLGFFVQQYGLMVLLALAVIVLVVLIALLARSGRRKRTAETAQGGQTIAVMDMPGEPPILDVTEVGNVHNIGKRNYQQDAFGVSPLQDEKLRHSRGVLAVLADGMGGMTNSGELSQAAVLAALRSFPQAPGGTGETLASVAHSVLDMVQKRFTGSGSGSTLVLANIRGGKLDFLTIGDSRIALLLKQKGIRCGKLHLQRRQRHSLFIDHRLLQITFLTGTDALFLKTKLYFEPSVPMSFKIFLLCIKHSKCYYNSNDQPHTITSSTLPLVPESAQGFPAESLSLIRSDRHGKIIYGVPKQGHITPSHHPA